MNKGDVCWTYGSITFPYTGHCCSQLLTYPKVETAASARLSDDTSSPLASLVWGRKHRRFPHTLTDSLYSLPLIVSFAPLLQRCIEHKPSMRTPSFLRCSSSSLSTFTPHHFMWLSSKEGLAGIVQNTHTHNHTHWDINWILFVNRFVGYPNNYGKLFGMRNEDVSQWFTCKCPTVIILHKPPLNMVSPLPVSAMSGLPTAVRSWRLPHRAGPATLHHHGGETIHQ